ncbi:flagellar hook-basal body complex protein [Shewanella sp. Scap07]|uniref:flagellar hook-basal body complex protein n=1 Tax=Shewanella sp. Scap07 TaxID=2589987 RepID=UPI0015B9249F|nr:flagellar hook-basal body complex protein [Shewanella sp. Scap07]QLE86310.1 flagellar hook-basal body complex protein [Shewanella sp. Scap07]
MKSCITIFLMLLFLTACNSESDNIFVITPEPPAINPPSEQNPIGEFELQTAVETDFFVFQKEPESAELYYANSNSLHFNKHGYLVNKTGSLLLVFPVNPDGSLSSVSIVTSQPIRISYSSGSPKATDKIKISANFPQNSNELYIDEFNNSDPSTYNHSVSTSVIDSLGDNHILTFYFIHVNTDTNTWEFRIALNDNIIHPATEQILDFDDTGLLDIDDNDLDGFTTTKNGLIDDINIPLSNGANDLNISLDFTAETTSYDSQFEVTSLDASGFYTGRVEEFMIEANGLITLSYTNGQDELLGKVAFAKFRSPYNLQPLGNSLWAETEDSGIPIYGEPQAANFNSILPVLHNF